MEFYFSTARSWISQHSSTSSSDFPTQVGRLSPHLTTHYRRLLHDGSADFCAITAKYPLASGVAVLPKSKGTALRRHGAHMYTYLLCSPFTLIITLKPHGNFRIQVCIILQGLWDFKAIFSKVAQIQTWNVFQELRDNWDREHRDWEGVWDRKSG
jgi:hypothetical protein